MPSVIEQAVKNWQGRLKDLEAKMAPLAQEADELRHAISLHDGAKPTRTPRRRQTPKPKRARTTRSANASRTTRTSRATPRRRSRPTTRSTRARTTTRRRSSRQVILATLKNKPGLTSGELATQTGLNRNTVATALSKMAAQGQLKKAKRGYRL
ncbi:MAG: winged helix-turn-helix domain-containing protein [Actinobacteria bacterium]|nr:MAG: winged helix-turn-helix domain-containing protein [Actinomycetota bacterium]